MIKTLRYWIEALFLGALFIIFRLMPVDMASAVGGFIARMIGARLASSRKAMRHIQAALPDLSEDQCRAAIVQMWDNLGRVVAEYPHLSYIARNRVTVEGEEHIDAALSVPGKGAVFFSLHMGNWEIPPTYLAVEKGADVHLMYRAPNNRWVDQMIHFWRTRSSKKLHAWSKSRAGGQGAMKGVRSGGALAILVDQKYNEGIDVPFFGMPAMTNPFFVKMAQKFDAPLVPSALVREKGARFTLKVFPPMDITDKSDETLLAEAHSILESVIRDHPGQWLWLHKRWRSEK